MLNHIPRVSIGLPVYNGEEYLAIAIDSLLAQTFADFELIVSDNASTDRTPEICREYAARDSRVQYSRQAVNRGAAWNFNRTFESARGEYFKWHAHDDVCAPTLLERCVEMLDRDRSRVLCFARWMAIDHNGEFVPDDAASWCPGSSASANGSHDRNCGLSSESPSRRVRAILLQSVWMFEQFGLMRASTVATTGGMRGYYMSDWVFLVEMALRGRFCEIPEVLFFPRRHGAQSSTLSSEAARRNAVKPRRFEIPLPLPHQIRPTIGHFRSVLSARISWGQRLRCLAVVVRYLFQVRKWKGIAVNTLRDFCASLGLIDPPKANLPGSKTSAHASAKSV